MHPVQERLAQLPTGPGCYLWRNAAGEDLYVGKAKNIRARVRSYFRIDPRLQVRIADMVAQAVDLEVVRTASEIEALLLENRLIKELQPPYNVRLKDGKDYPLLAISREPFPRVFLTRDQSLAGVDLIGPFLSMTELRRAYHALMRVFRFRTCDLDIQEDDARRRHFRPCLNWHIKRCSAPCTTRIDREHYAADIRALRAVLSGRGVRPVVQDLTTRMRAASADLRFEDAAYLRDQLQSLDRLQERGNLRDFAADQVVEVKQQESMQALRRVLGLRVPPRTIEGFDLAHLQGRHVVAAMVQFVDGQPNPDGYRRYKIEANVEGERAGNNDFAGMAEVVTRRYTRLRSEGAPWPDVVLIDGGEPQVRAAMAALAAVDIQLPCVVGLAKEEETLVFPDGSRNTPGRRHAGLKILMHVRDEAHRFCRRYFHLLQHRALKDGA